MRIFKKNGQVEIVFRFVWDRKEQNKIKIVFRLYWIEKKE